MNNIEESNTLIVMDLLDNNTAENKHVLVMIDAQTKFVTVAATKSDSENVSETISLKNTVNYRKHFD